MSRGGTGTGQYRGERRKGRAGTRALSLRPGSGRTSRSQRGGAACGGGGVLAGGPYRGPADCLLPPFSGLGAGGGTPGGPAGRRCPGPAPGSTGHGSGGRTEAHAKGRRRAPLRRPFMRWYPEPGLNRHGIGRGILSPLCLPIPPSGRGLLCSWPLLRRQGAAPAERRCQTGGKPLHCPRLRRHKEDGKDVRFRAALLCPGHAAGPRPRRGGRQGSRIGTRAKGVTGGQTAMTGGPGARPCVAVRDKAGGKTLPLPDVRPWGYPA